MEDNLVDSRLGHAVVDVHRLSLPVRLGHHHPPCIVLQGHGEWDGPPIGLLNRHHLTGQVHHIVSIHFQEEICLDLTLLHNCKQGEILKSNPENIESRFHYYTHFNRNRIQFRTENGYCSVLSN